MKHAGDAVPLLGHVKAPNSLCDSMGDAGATARPALGRGQSEHHWSGRASLDRRSLAGWAAHRRAAAAVVGCRQRGELWLCSLFKMQLCKGHRGGDETRSCNKEGEIKNNDRNKLS